MKASKIFSILTLLAAFVVSLHAGANTAQAEPPQFVIDMLDSHDCPMPGSDANGKLIFGGVGEAVVTVENENFVILTCLGMDITNDSGRAQVFDEMDFTCSILTASGDVVQADEARVTITPTGVASMTCKYFK